MENLYEFLQVSPRASTEVIRAAYLAAIQGLDTTDEAFKQIHQAWETLTNPKKRAEYDSQWKSLDGKIIGGRYQVLEAIGEGEYYQDYKGKHAIGNFPVLIRQCSELSSEKEEYLLKEAEALWDLRNHGLQVIRDIFRLEDGSLAIVMSYIEGKTLKDYVRELGALEPETVAWIAQRILNTLWYMHERGVIHKGINPKSVIIQDHLVVLANLSRCAIDCIEDKENRQFARVFAPPEEESGFPLVPESDLFSVGMTMLYALNGGEIDLVEKRRVPSNVPEPLMRFIRDLIVLEVTERPNWQNSNPFEEIQKVREESFGRLHSEMKPVSNGK
jgi:serine/threonine protein kinase